MSTKIVSYLSRIPVVYRCTRQLSGHYLNKKILFNVYINCKEKYEDVLVTPSTVPNSKWEDLRKYVMENNVDMGCVDVILLELFKQQECPDSGISYFKFLENTNNDIEIITMLKYLELYHVKSDPLSETDKANISKYCKSILNKCGSFEIHASNTLICSLCQIDEWQEAIRIMEMYEAIDHGFLKHGYNALISYFFQHGKPDLGYKYLEGSFIKGGGPLFGGYKAYLQYCVQDKDTFNENIEKLFNMWNKYGIKPPIDVIQEYVTACNQFGWHAESTSTSGSICNECKQSLSSPSMSDKDFNRLRKAITEKLIINQMYDVTKPEEMSHFKKFIDGKEPYDIIIDVLNCVHSSKLGYEVLYILLKYYKKRGKKVLGIGRHHLKKTLLKRRFRDLADFFFVEDISKDDAFILFAAFSSGKNTKVISKDLMRNHKFAISDKELGVLFKKWQSTQQYTVTDDMKNLMKLNSLVPIDGIVQKQNNCWHIPYSLNQSQTTMRHTSDTQWFCFKCP